MAGTRKTGAAPTTSAPKTTTPRGKSGAAAPGRAVSSGSADEELRHQLLSEQVRGAKLKNDSAEAAHKREHSEEGESHFNRRRDAGTVKAEAESRGARQKAAHERQMGHHAENAAASAHHAQLQLNAHKKTMQAHERAAAEQRHEHHANAERRAQEAHEQSMRIREQQAQAAGRAHKRSAAVTAAHLLFGGAGGSAKAALHKQVG